MSTFCGRCGRDIPAGKEAYRVWGKVGESRGGELGVGSFGYFISSGSQEQQGWTVWCSTCYANENRDLVWRGVQIFLFILAILGFVLYKLLAG